MFDPTKEDLSRHLCQIISDQADSAALAILPAQEWADLVAHAQAERLAPLLYWVLKQNSDLLRLPSDLQQELSQAFYASEGFNQLLFRELKRHLMAFDQAGIEAIVIKGAALAPMLYPSLGLRPMGDVDLLVRKEHIPAAVRVVESLGYVEVFPEFMGVAEWLDHAANHHVHLRGGEQGKSILEIHWTLVAGEVDRRSPPMDWFWQHKMGYPMEGVEGLSHVFQLTPTAHLLYLSAHLALQHAVALVPLLWVYDLHRLISEQGERIDWVELTEPARLFGWLESLRIAIDTSQTYFGTQIPANLFLGLASQTQVKMDNPVLPSGNRLIDTWQQTGTLGGFTRLRLFLSLLFPRKSYMHWRYDPRPSWLWPLYYLYRWFDILREGVKALRLSGNKG